MNNNNDNYCVQDERRIHNKIIPRGICVLLTTKVNNLLKYSIIYICMQI